MVGRRSEALQTGSYDHIRLSRMAWQRCRRLQFLRIVSWKRFICCCCCCCCCCFYLLINRSIVVIGPCDGHAGHAKRMLRLEAQRGRRTTAEFACHRRRQQRRRPTGSPASTHYDRNITSSNLRCVSTCSSPSDRRTTRAASAMRCSC
jgi:hypothetical protein